jgi:hypothetical protein
LHLTKTNQILPIQKKEKEVISLNLDDKIDMPQVKGVLKIPG